MIRSWRHTTLSALLTFIVAAFATNVAAADQGLRVGMSLVEGLQLLQRGGLELVYSSQVVSPDLRIRTAVVSNQPRTQLDELLSPHGLAAVEGPDGVLIVVARRNPTPPPAAKPPLPDSPELAVEDEIFVEPTRHSLLGDDPPPPLTLGRTEIEEHSKVADDVFRALDVLPGVTTGDVSAELHIRGARRDEMLVLLDGQELYEPYHLRDFDNPLSIVDSSALERVSLLTGAFPVNYGDRVAGVLDMTTSPPASQRRVTISASILDAQLDASDTHADGRLGWMASGRRGSTDVIGRAFDFEDPRFWDFFGKLDYQLTSRQSARASLLMSRNSFHYLYPDEVRRIDTDYDSSYLWLSHQNSVSPRIYMQTILSSSLLEQRRSGIEQNQIRAYEVSDDRRFDALGLIHSGGVQLGTRNFLTFGLEYQRFETRYDYSSLRRESFTNAPELERSFVLDDRFDTENTTLYASDRFHPVGNLTLELGLRYDAQTSRDGSLVSPRLSIAWAARPSDVLRLAWGRYSQSHRPYELMVEDGDANLYPAEQSEQWALGYERIFSPRLRLPLQSLRADAYVRNTGNPRPRYENLFASYHPFPEGEAFRVRIEPESATARGIELLLRGRGTSRWGWWLNYALADTSDRIDGEDVPRRIDQTHSLNADLTWRPTPRWSVNFASLYHTGWPVTDVVLEESNGGLVAVVGPLNGARLRNYNRVDLRVSRDFKARGGVLTLFVDTQNLMNNGNEAGIELRIGNESGDLEIRPERWSGVLTSGGVVWRF